MKKKLLFINGHLNTGGVEKSLLDILQHLDYDAYEVDLLLLEELGDYMDQIPDPVHVELRCLKNTYGSLKSSLSLCIREKDWFCFRMRLIFLLQKLLGQKVLRLARNLMTDGVRYDCAVGFRSGICTELAAWAVNADRRITWWHHGELNVDLRAYSQAVSGCDAVAVVSEACRKMLAEAMPQIGQKLCVIPNMLDASMVQKKANDFVPDYDKARLQIVSVGRLSPEKHFENIIPVAERLKQEGISFCWHLVGDGPMREPLQEQIKAAGLTRKVVLEGNQPNPYPYMKCADLFVHPSYVESQGIVVMEAMALGVPCVVTKSLGPCEFIEDGVNGVLTEQSAESLTEKVLGILGDQELYKCVKDHTECPDRFLPEQVMESIQEIL